MSYYEFVHQNLPNKRKEISACSLNKLLTISQYNMGKTNKRCKLFSIPLDILYNQSLVWFGGFLLLF